MSRHHPLGTLGHECAHYVYILENNVIQKNFSPVGFGTEESPIKIYIANRPPIDDYPRMNELRGLVPGEIDHIVRHTSNHWRKVFNVYAKFLFDWENSRETATGGTDLPDTWQTYRDTRLFQPASIAALLFSTPQVHAKHSTFHLVAGKTYAATLDLPPLTWLDNHFAINENHRVIVTPYPDYRQLSNARIATLIALMETVSQRT